MKTIPLRAAAIASLVLVSWMGQGALGVGAQYEATVGVVVSKDGAYYLALDASEAPPGAEITFVRTATPQWTSEFRLLGRAANAPGDELPLVMIGNRSLSLFELEPLSDLPAGPLLGIGVLGLAERFSVAGAVVVAELDEDGRPEYFHECTSGEGVHLILRSGDRLTGQRRWQAYYYLGYNVEPTCTARELLAARPPDIGAGVRFQAEELGPGWHRGFFNQTRTVPPCYILMTFEPRSSADEPLRVKQTLPITRVERLQVTDAPGTSMQEWDALVTPEVPENSWHDIQLAPLRPVKGQCQFDEKLGR